MSALISSKNLTTKLSILAIIVITAFPAGLKAQTDGFTNSFNHSDGTTYDKTKASADMGLTEYWLNSQNSKVYNASLRIEFDENKFGTNCGMVSRVALNADQTYSVEYKLKFDEGFDFRLGGKIPGLAGGSAPTGGGKPTDGSGFSTRFMWRQGGRLVVYAYFMDQINFYGDDWQTGVTMVPGEWYTIKEQVTVNTGNNSDGRVEVWVNGEKKLDRTSLRLMNIDNAVDAMYMDCFMGGNDPSWSPDHSQFLTMDDFVCIKGGDGGSIDPIVPSTDLITNVETPELVEPGKTFTVTVEYEASTDRDIIVAFQKDSDPWTHYGEQVRTSVGVGKGSIEISVPIDSEIPDGKDDYQFQTFITTAGGNWDEKLSNVSKNDIDLFNLDLLGDEIVSISSPNEVTPGESATGISVDYAASGNRDIQVLFQLNVDPWTIYGQKTIEVTPGTGTIEVDIPIDDDTPSGEGEYKFMAFITTDNGNWDARFDQKETEEIDAIAPITPDPGIVTHADVSEKTGALLFPTIVSKGEKLIYRSVESGVLQVYNLNGMLINGTDTYSITKGDNLINTSLLSRGMYIVKVSSEPSAFRFFVD